MNTQNKVYTREDLPGLMFIVAPVHQVAHGVKCKDIDFKILSITNSEALVIWDGYKFPERYGINWVLKYLNEGIWRALK